MQPNRFIAHPKLWTTIGVLFLSCFPARADEPSDAKSVYLQMLRQRYEELAQLSETMPKEAFSWLKQDIQNINTWEYRILTIATGKDQEMLEQLSELGSQRWELVSIVPTGAELKLFLKRPRKSYVKSLPVKDLLKVLGGQEE